MPDPAAPAERIWIIGASEGIGAALASAWAGPRVRLILSARSEPRFVALAERLGPGHLPLDVGDPGRMEAAAARIAADGPLDRIVHLAAIYEPGRVNEQVPAMAARIVAVNLAGSFHVARIATRILRPGGQLALCGSVAGYFACRGGRSIPPPRSRSSTSPRACAWNWRTGSTCG